MKKIPIITLLLISFLTGMAQDISYPNPYKYHNDKEGIVVKVLISPLNTELNTNIGKSAIETYKLKLNLK